MTSEWDARVYILKYTHRWPIAILAFLIGCILGLFISYVLPSSYKAENSLYVAYNADLIFRNPEDYKNWHMEQLNALAIAPDVIQNTLDNLQQIDPYWNEVTPEELKQSLDVQWRNTGIWHLFAVSNTPEHASQAITTWINVFLETYKVSTSAALDMLSLNARIYSLNHELLAVKTRHAELSRIKEAILTINEAITQNPSNFGLDSLTRSRLYSLIARASDYDPAWKSLIDSFPVADALTGAYLPWIEEANISLDVAIEDLSPQIDSYETELNKLEVNLEQALQASRGLSTNIYVEQDASSQNKLSPTRQTSVFSLIGGLIGLIVWFVIGLVQSSLKITK